MESLTALLLFTVLAQAPDAPLGGEAWRAGLRERVAGAIKDLSSDEFERRDAASRSLLALAEFCEADLEAAIEGSTDAEASSRLRGLIEARRQVHDFVVRSLLPKEPFDHRTDEPQSIPAGMTEAVVTHRLLLRGVAWGEVPEQRIAGALRDARPDLARDALVLRLSDPSTPVRAGACWMLGALGVSEAAPVLRERLRDRRRTLRRWAAQALFRIPDPGMADLLFDDTTFAALLEDDRREVPAWRREWLLRVYECGGIAALAGVLEGRPGVGEDIGSALQPKLAERALSAADLAVCEKVIDGDYPRSLQHAAASILVERRGGDPRERLRAGMAHRCPEVRSLAVGSALRRCEIDDEELIVAARTLLDDTDPLVRKNAFYHCLSLGDLGVLDRALSEADPADAQAFSSVISAVLDLDRTRRFAGKAFGLLERATTAQLWSRFNPSSGSRAAEYWMGDGRVDDLLWRRLVEENDPPRTRDYLDAAQRLLAPGSSAHALALLHSSDPVIHDEAAQLLCRLKPEAIPPELDMYVSANDSLGELAVQSLVDSGRREVVLARIDGWMKDDDTRWRALRVIERLHVVEWAPKVRRLLAEDDPHWRMDIVRTLASLDDRESLPAMREAYLGTSDPASDRVQDLPRAAMRIGGRDEVRAWIAEADGRPTGARVEHVGPLCALLGKEGIERLATLKAPDDQNTILACLDPRFPDPSLEIVLELWPHSAGAVREPVWLVLASTGDEELYRKLLSAPGGADAMSERTLFRVLAVYVGQDGVGDAIALLEADPKRHYGAFVEVFLETEDIRLDAAMRFLWKAIPGEERRSVLTWLEARTTITPERWALLGDLEKDCAPGHLYWLRAVGRAWRAREP